MSQLDTDTRILGAGFLDYQNELIIQLGSYKVTRQECATALGLSSTNAARNFQRACEALNVRSIAGLFHTNPRKFAERDRCAAGTMNVAIKVLRKNGYSILDWYRSAAEQIVTFASLKLQVQRENAKEAKEARAKGNKRATLSRSAQAHRDFGRAQNVAEFKARNRHAERHTA